MKLFPADTLSRLQAAADVAIWKSHSDTPNWHLRRGKKSKAPEEDYVAAFVLLALPKLAKAWKPLFLQQGLELSLTGVFCHNTPKASFSMSGNIKSCELADLLIVRRHTEKNKTCHQTAVLLQAKMSTDGRIKLTSNDRQLYLLSHWPKFQLEAQNAPSTEFEIGNNPNQALYYGIRARPPHPKDNDAWAGFCPWAIMPPKQNGWVEESLSSYLVKMLNFEVGRDFFDPTTVECHWTQLIHYFLEITFSLPLRTRDMSPEDTGRGVTMDINRMAFMATDQGRVSAFIPESRLKEIANGGGDDLPPEVSNQFDDGGEGRVLLIETWEAEG